MKITLLSYSLNTIFFLLSFITLLSPPCSNPPPVMSSSWSMNIFFPFLEYSDENYKNKFTCFSIFHIVEFQTNTKSFSTKQTFYNVHPRLHDLSPSLLLPFLSFLNICLNKMMIFITWILSCISDCDFEMIMEQ